MNGAIIALYVFGSSERHLAFILETRTNFKNAVYSLNKVNIISIFVLPFSFPRMVEFLIHYLCDNKIL